MRLNILCLLAVYPLYTTCTLIPFTLTGSTFASPSPRASSAHHEQCLRFHETDLLRDMCPAFQQSDLDSFQALFPDVSILSGLGHDADFNLLYGSQSLDHAGSSPQTRSIGDRYDADGTTLGYGRRTSFSGDDMKATAAPEMHMPLDQGAEPSTLHHQQQQRDTTLAGRGGSSGGSKEGPLSSYGEWHQRHLPKDNERRPVRRKPGGLGAAAGGPGRQMIDSVDGVFADDFGSMFEAKGQLPANVYNENEYIEPSESPAVPSSSNNGNRGQRFADVPVQSLKERFNYASIDCAATVRGANKEAKGAQSILYESKDQYMLNKCSASKYVIINLCEEIQIDTIVLANFEFFSSTFKDFRVYVADRYPTNDWKLLGQWQARNTRDLQVFKVTNRIGWFDNIKIEFLTHYGHEYYCPLSLVRVHGMYMWEYYNLIESQNLAGGTDEDALIEKYLWPSEVRDEIIHPRLDTANDTAPMPESKDDDHKQHVPIIPPIPEDQIYIVPEPRQSELSGTASVIMDGASTTTMTTLSTATPTIPSFTEISVASNSIPVIPAEPSLSVEQGHPREQPDYDDRESGSRVTTSPAMPTDDNLESNNDQRDATCMAVWRTLNENAQPTLQASAEPTDQGQPSATSSAHPSASSLVGPWPSGNHAAEETAAAAAVSRVVPMPKIPHKDGNAQESIYKTIMKRLNALEVNATLSQRYLDEQNRILNDVLRNMEQRHQDQLIMLLGRLNDTASSRIESMRYRYEQLYDELRYQSERTSKEMATKMSLLADQIAFERRVSMAQLVVVITLFVFVALSRGTLSILSPIMEAQAQERKRRESADHPTAIAAAAAALSPPTIGPKTTSPSSSTVSCTPEKRDNIPAKDAEPPAMSSPSVGDEEEEQQPVDECHRRSNSEGGGAGALVRSWSDVGLSSTTKEDDGQELPELLRQRKPTNQDAVVPDSDDLGAANR